MRGHVKCLVKSTRGYLSSVPSGDTAPLFLLSLPLLLLLSAHPPQLWDPPRTCPTPTLPDLRC